MNNSTDTKKYDAISRPAAIDVTNAIWRVTGDKNVVKVWEQLKGLPPAEPPWIPCSERLPRHQTQVIVSGYDDSGDIPIDYTACGWVTKDGKYWIVDNNIDNFIVAWMPMPKPYKVKKEG